MLPTLHNFTQALLSPDLSLTTLAEAHVATDAHALPRLTRTTRFVEAEISWQGQQWLLSMPLTPSALPAIERTAAVLHRLHTAWLTDYRILPRELHWQDVLGGEQTGDLVLQLLPPGCEFSQALLAESKQTLQRALDALQAELRRLEFTHNNLKAANLRWCNGRLIPLRYHDARVGEAADRDAAAFEVLRREIEAAGDPLTLCDVAASYTPTRPLEGHRWTSNTFEGLICVEDSTGYGFVDPENHTVIAAQYLWAGDFHEGRAEVQTPTGMGLIDREGRYIIAPDYEIVDYDAPQSVVHVRQGGRWALFDYLGRRLTEFREREAIFETI
ncbi:MAG: WG repeat-containing protein [Alistipes sp.]